MKSKLQLMGAMGIFGTIGAFVKYIPLPAATIAMIRGMLGVAFLILAMVCLRQKPSWVAIRKNLVILIFSGAAIGFNWVLLFESYHYTSTAVATICYYLAPLFLILMSPLIGERLTAKKLICVFLALAGMVLISGILEGQTVSGDQLMGILLATGAAVLYATVMLLNKKLSPIPAYDKTILQLGFASLVILPYVLVSKGFDFTEMTWVGWAHLAVLGVVHTGISYAMYFGSMKNLPAHTIAIFSYLDPMLAVLLSALVLQEKPLGLFGWLGAALILGCALYSELPERKKN